VEQTVKQLAGHGIVPRMSDAISFARQEQVLLLRHEASGTPIDLTLAWLPFEEEALAHATRQPFADISIRVVQPEDLIVLKAVAWREQDRADVERLLLRWGNAIDLDRVRELVRRLPRPWKSRSVWPPSRPSSHEPSAAGGSNSGLPRVGANGRHSGSMERTVGRSQGSRIW